MKANQTAKIKPGLYRLYWREGGHSLASIGVDASGKLWVAPVNWLSPIQNPDAKFWRSVDRVESVSDVNLNTAVRVQLTRFGRMHWRAFWQSMGLHQSNLEVELHGNLETQLHELMHVFGSTLFMGATDLPFKNNRITLIPNSEL